MNTLESSAQIFFDGVYWVLIHEIIIDGEYYASKYIFGSEPSQPEIFKFILSRKYLSLKYSQGKTQTMEKTKKINPKRMQRIISKQISKPCVTKAQETIKKQYEEKKKVNKKKRKLKKEELLNEKFRKKQLKKKEKKKGH